MVNSSKIISSTSFKFNSKIQPIDNSNDVPVATVQARFLVLLLTEIRCPSRQELVLEGQEL